MEMASYFKRFLSTNSFPVKVPVFRDLPWLLLAVQLRGSGKVIVLSEKEASVGFQIGTKNFPLDSVIQRSRQTLSVTQTPPKSELHSSELAHG